MYDMIMLTTKNAMRLVQIIHQILNMDLFVPSFQWFTWPQVFGSYTDGPFQSFFSYIMYILWSTVFATFAVLLVKVFAPYACGSGIPEVN